jgi:hypothetical protein
LNIFFSRRCFFIHACLWPASGRFSELQCILELG